MRRVTWVSPETHRIVKFLPSSPPHRGETILVDGTRCKVLRCRVRWDGPRWTIGHVKVKAIA